MKPILRVSGASAAKSVTGSKPAIFALPPSRPPIVGQEVGVEQPSLGRLRKARVKLEIRRAVRRRLRMTPCGNVLAAARQKGAELDLSGHRDIQCCSEFPVHAAPACVMKGSRAAQEKTTHSACPGSAAGCGVGWAVPSARIASLAARATRLRIASETTVPSAKSEPEA